MKMPRKLFRMLVIVTMLLTLITVLPISAFAAESEYHKEHHGSVTLSAPGATSNGYMSQMGNEAFKLYRSIVSLVFPFAILSIAKCGFDILFSTWMGKGEAEIAKAKKRAVLTFMAMICIIMLPLVVSYIKNKVAPTAWEPPSGLSPFVGDWSDYLESHEPTEP